MTSERPALSPLEKLRKKAGVLRDKYIRSTEVFDGLLTPGFTQKRGLRQDVLEDPDHPEKWNVVDNTVRAGLVRERLEEVAIPEFLNQLEKVADKIEIVEAEQAEFEARMAQVTRAFDERLVRLATRREQASRLVDKGFLEPANLAAIDADIEREQARKQQAIQVLEVSRTVPALPTPSPTPEAPRASVQPPVPAVETPDALKRRRYQEAAQLFEVILPDGQVVQIQGKKKADLLKALLAKAGCHASAEELCLDVYGQYDPDLVHSLNPLVRSLKRDLIRYNYQIVQPVGPEERGQGKKADYHLKPITQWEVPVQKTSREVEVGISPEVRRWVEGLKLSGMEKKLLELMLSVGGQTDMLRDTLVDGLFSEEIRSGEKTRSHAIKHFIVIWSGLKRKVEKQGGLVKLDNRHPPGRAVPGIYYWEEAAVPTARKLEEEEDLAGLEETPSVPMSSIRREGEEPIRVPVERTKEELRTPLENALLTYVVDWLTKHNDLYFDRLHQAIAPFNGPRIREEGGLRKFFPYSARELQDTFESALTKLANDALFEEVNEDWADAELWKKVQDLRDIMHATDLHDLLRKTKIEIAKSERQFKAINPPQDGGRVWWITL